jgi:hypothetical protein
LSLLVRLQDDCAQSGLCGEVEHMLASLGPLQGELAAEMELFQQVRGTAEGSGVGRLCKEGPRAGCEVTGRWRARPAPL